ncbi:putative glycoside hydrolase [Bacillus thermotolerans]|uniref:Glycoside hydrolase n=1 Tax=Bacillus thermotolerans TaxID=1221996 RepID=A0A0F5HXV3_BACTR|nr:putative glycoside hydrolase [Bacillus thermotolerans]KKB38121.1 putative glycoside hydrolase [Bacillus thermotolerans]KKB40785.1 putative glycoside hydrolase [Bacillus thermotolerans]KKB43210.1 putative glycoside hydrolase [Bacillus thermotolerans]
MKKRKICGAALLLTGGLLLSGPVPGQAAETTEFQTRPVPELNKEIPENMVRFQYDSGLEFEYPDAVRGIYVTGHSAGGPRFDELMQLIEETDLNAMVVDIKDDFGKLTYQPEPGSPFEDIAEPVIKDPRAMLEEMEKKQVYPIARVVVFKDTTLAQKKPEWSFTRNGQVWANGGGESFVNPFVKDVWDYNVNIAIEAAKMGFKEIQFDYVRFPEGFETRDKTLEYSLGDYEDSGQDLVQRRVQAVTDFVAYAREKLEPYNVDVSVDIFGYSATLPEAPGIGQNFSKISENVDVISSMIYPSHWTSYFGIAKPDTEPYRLVREYAKVENEKLAALDTPPTSRPWLQDFTASWLGSGNYIRYGKEEIEAQIRALNDSGIDEFLLWNASNNYTENVDYTPEQREED